MTLMQQLKLSLLIDKKYHAMIIKRAKKKGLSVGKYLTLIMEKNS